MENIGKCLQFYLKYPAEMERLLTEGLEKEGLRDPDAVLKKINAVSAKANQEAAEFLEKCAQGIEGHFEKIGYPVQRSRNNLEKDWELIFKIGSKGGALDRRAWIGVAIVTTPPSLIPYVWCRGGRRVEGEIVDSLGRGFPIENPEFDSGSVGLAKIDIPIPNRLEESVTCDALIAKVHQAFAFFTTEDVEKIDKINSA